MRSTIAISVAFLFLPNLFEGKTVKFLIALIAASFVHRTALVFLVFFIATMIKSKKALLLYYAALICIPLLGFGLFANAVTGVFGYYSIYFASDFSGSGIRYLLFLAGLLAFVYYCLRKRSSDSACDSIETALLRMSETAVCLQLVSLRISFFVRAVNYHVLAFVILIPNVISRDMNNRPLVLLAVIVVFQALFLYVLYDNGLRTVPYALCF